jgi:hypothetical protein
VEASRAGPVAVAHAGPAGSTRGGGSREQPTRGLRTCTHSDEDRGGRVEGRKRGEGGVAPEEGREVARPPVACRRPWLASRAAAVRGLEEEGNLV